MSVIQFPHTEAMAARKSINLVVNEETKSRLDFDAEPQVENLKNLDIREVARRLRSDIKNAQKLDVISSKVKVSVRVDRGGTCGAVRLAVKKADFEVYNPDYNPRNIGGVGNPRYTAQGSDLLAVLKSLSDVYHEDNNDHTTDYFDVNFHLSIGYDYDLSIELS